MNSQETRIWDQSQHQNMGHMVCLQGGVTYSQMTSRSPQNGTYKAIPLEDQARQRVWPGYGVCAPFFLDRK